MNEFTEAIRAWNKSNATLPDLLAIVAEATRELCAEFPQHQCHNGATNNWRVAEKVAAHIKANYL
jgi:hypothetical protein